MELINESNGETRHFVMYHEPNPIKIDCGKLSSISLGYHTPVTLQTNFKLLPLKELTHKLDNTIDTQNIFI